MEDAEAFGRVIEAHQKQVYGLALRLTGRPDAAEDITQETFLAAWKALPSWKGTGTMQAWIMTIAVNKVRSYWRWARLRRWLSLDAETPDGGTLADAVADPSPAPDPALEAVLQKALSELTARQREAVVLRAQGLSVEETAQVLGVAEGTVKATFFQAKQKLQERLKGAL